MNIQQNYNNNRILVGEFLFDISDQMCHQAFNIGCKTLHAAHVMDMKEANTEIMLNNLLMAESKFNSSSPSLSSSSSSSSTTTTTSPTNVEQGIASNEGHLKIQSFFKTNDKCFIVYEPLVKDAVTLLDLMKARNNLPENFVRKVAQLLFAYINQMHNKYNIVHLDLKLHNIYVYKSEGQWRIKVKDLRFCEFVNPANSYINSHRGSPAYLAPEVTMSGKPYDAKKAEIYTAGVILYTLATGSYPFVASNPQSLIQMIRSSPLSFPQHMSFSLRNLLEQMLSKNPDSRPDVSILLKNDWIQDAEKFTLNEQNQTSLTTTTTTTPLHLAQSCMHASSSAGHANFLACLPATAKPATVC